MARRRSTAVAIGLGMSLLAAACGGDDAEEATGGTVDVGVRSGVEQQLGGSATSAASPAAPRPTSIEEWERRWADERAAIVENIKDNGWGKSADGKTVTGPEGFTIDLTRCPGGWSDTEGVNDTEIKIGQAIAQSGSFADYGNYARAIQVLFDHYNSKGAFTDVNGRTRRVNYVVRDDHYDAARTIPVVDELLDSQRVFAVWTLGSPNTLKTYDKLNQRCIPQPLAMTGHPAWGDPVNHPWTTGMTMAYSTEAVLWGAFIEQRIDTEFDGNVKVAALVMNNDFGKSYEVAFRSFLAESPHRDKIEFITETIEPQAPTVKDPMTTLAAQQPDVFIGMIAAAPCTQAIIEAAENGMKEDAKYLFMPSTCRAATFVGKEKVGGDGSATDGWWIVAGGALDFNADANSGDAFIKWGRELLAAAGIDYHTSGSFGSGMPYGWAAVQALQIAGQLDGGLTRSNFILALRSMDMTHPMYLEGIRFNMRGNADPYLIEGSDISRYDSKAQTWVPQGPVIELSGKSKPCAFNQATSVCA